MPKRISRFRKKPTKREDANQAAFRVVSQTTEMDNNTIHAVMAEMGRKGGKIGGKRRLDTMSPEERRERASHAAKVRWGKE